MGSGVPFFPLCPSETRFIECAHTARRSAAGGLPTIESVNRDHGPWILVALIPEHPGALEISQTRLRQMQPEYASRDLLDIGHSGAHFE